MHLLGALLVVPSLFGPADAAGQRETEGGGTKAAALCLSVIPDLDRRMSQLDSHTVTYSIVTYGPRAGEDPTFELPEDAEAADRVDLIKVATVYKSGTVYRVHEQAIWTRRGPEEADTIGTFTSDGTQYHTRFASARGGRSTLMLDLSDAMHRVGPQMDAYGWRVLGQVAPLDYQRYMRWAAESDELRATSASDDQAVIQWRFLPDLPQTRMTATIDKHRTRLTAIQMDVHNGDAALPGSKVVLRKSVQFREHDLGDDTVLIGARVTDQLSDAGEDWPAAWAVIIVTPIAIEPSPRVRDQILLRPRNNELIQDSRFDIAYPWGDNRINLDGLVVGLERPADSDVGWNLDRWVPELPALAAASLRLPARTGPNAGKTSVVTFDAGDVLVEGNEPASAQHRFIVHNDSETTWNVKDLVKSCGCLTCEISTRSIQPGADAALDIAMTVPSPGERRQEVAVVFDDGTIRKFELRARGYSPGRLRVVSSGFTKQQGVWRAEIRAYWTESEQMAPGGSPPPLTIDPRDGTALRFAGWSLIEPASADRQRPRKLFGRGVIELDQFPEAFDPAGLELVFRAGKVRSFTLPIVNFDREGGVGPAEVAD